MDPRSGRIRTRLIVSSMGEQITLYTIASIVFIMWIHFAIHIRREFALWAMAGVFVVGGCVGYFLDNMAVGFVFAVVCTFLFW